MISSSQIVDKPVQATFGRYGLNCSSGRGACSFSLMKSIDSEGRTASKGTGNTFVLTMNRNTISNEDEKRIAGKPFNDFKQSETPIFIQEQMLHLDESTLQYLNIDKSYSNINPGKYKMVITQEQVQILITLNQPN